VVKARHALPDKGLDSLIRFGKVASSKRRRTMIDRAEAARCLAKAIAYKACGKNVEAAERARKLIAALELAEILR
jgi:hypothetical protein